MLSVERDLIPSLGRSMDDVAALPGLPPDREEYVDEVYVSWSYPSKGLELTFGAEDGRLRTIFLHAAGHEGFSGFPFRLPLGLDFDVGPADVVAILGPPSQTGGGQESPIDHKPIAPWSVHWLPTCALHVQYSHGCDRVVLITIMRPDVAPVGSTH